MANPKLPQNQIAALPLLTPEAAADPGETLIIGGKLLKYWSPTALGLISAPYAVILAGAGGYGSRAFFSSAIDTTGCLSFSFQMRRRLPTVAEAGVVTWTLYFQPQFDPALGGLNIFATLDGGLGGGSLRQSSLVRIDTISFQDTVATGFVAPDDEVATRSFSFASQDHAIGTNPTGPSPYQGLITTRGRFFIDSSSSLATPADARVWCCLWGSG